MKFYRKISSFFAAVIKLKQEEKYDEVLMPKNLYVDSFFSAVKENDQPPANANKPY
jgi:hypothetical protein